MKAKLRTLMLMIVAFLVVPFLADLHVPFGSGDNGVAFAKDGGGGGGDSGGSGGGSGSGGSGSGSGGQRRSGAEATAGATGATAAAVGATVGAAEVTAAAMVGRPATARTRREAAKDKGRAVMAALAMATPAAAQGTVSQKPPLRPPTAGERPPRRPVRVIWVGP